MFAQKIGVIETHTTRNSYTYQTPSSNIRVAKVRQENGEEGGYKLALVDWSTG